MIKTIVVPVIYCICHRCLFEFLVHTDKPPLRCRNNACRTLEWNSEEPPLRAHDLAARRRKQIQKCARW